MAIEKGIYNKIYINVYIFSVITLALDKVQTG